MLHLPFLSSQHRMLLSAAILSFILAIVALYVHTAYYLPFISDDALISLRYAQRLLAGHGLT